MSKEEIGGQRSTEKVHNKTWGSDTTAPCATAAHVSTSTWPVIQGRAAMRFVADLVVSKNKIAVPGTLPRSELVRYFGALSRRGEYPLPVYAGQSAHRCTELAPKNAAFVLLRAHERGAVNCKGMSRTFAYYHKNSPRHAKRCNPVF